MNRTVQGWLRSFSRSRNTSKSNRQVRQQPTSRGPLELEQLELRTMVSHAIGDHIHPILRIVVDGQDVVIPANIGLTPTRHFSPHTHDTTGVLHLGESPIAGIDPLTASPRFTTLKDFFDVWRTTNPGTPQNNPDARFDSTHLMDRVADATHFIRMTVNGQPSAELNRLVQNYSPHGTSDPNDPNNEHVLLEYVEIVNQAPMGNAQIVNVLPQSTSSITLSGDDGDPQVTQTLSFRVQTLPASGTLRDSGGNAVTVGTTLPTPKLSYTPGPGFSATDSFTFVVMDNGGTNNGGQDTSAPATVSIAAATNHAPTANAQTLNVTPETARSITLTGVDGDAGVTQALSFQVQTLPTNGTLHDSGGNAATLGTPLPSANVTYTPNAGFTGADNFSFIVKDDGGTANGGQDTSAIATVSLNVSSRPITPPGTAAFDGTEKLRADGRLMVHGGPADNTMIFALNASGDQLEVTLDGNAPRTFALADVHDLCLKGGRGDDTIAVGSDVDIPAHIMGGRGDDQITGGAAADRIRGGRGNDTIDGGDGADSIAGGRGHDSLSGGDGNDRMWGDGRQSHYVGNDTMDGGVGNDTMTGGRGRDSMLGDDGNDLMAGGRGADRLDGGAGSDTMRGGRGTDIDMNPDPADRVFGMP